MAAAQDGPARTHPWSRMVSIGDSFTEGMIDPDPHRPGMFRGWADRTAAALAERSADPAGFRYANLAVRGRLLADVCGPQLEAALELEPDLVTIVGGGNDILRPRADVEALAARLDEAVSTIRAAGADVVMATPVLPADAPVLRLTSGRVGVFAAYVGSVARRRGAHLLDQFPVPALRQARVWGPDRIHLTSHGHEIVTLLALVALGVVGREGEGSGVAGDDLFDRCERIAAGAEHVELGPGSNLRWAREFAAPWVGRRLRGRSSGDSVAAKRPLLHPLDG